MTERRLQDALEPWFRADPLQAAIPENEEQFNAATLRAIEALGAPLDLHEVAHALVALEQRHPKPFHRAMLREIADVLAQRAAMLSRFYVQCMGRGLYGAPSKPTNDQDYAS